MSASIRSETTRLITRGLVVAAVAMLLPAIQVYAQDSAIYVQCPDDADPTTKCIHLVGGDGMITMADGEEMYIFSFAKLDLPGTNGAPTNESGNYPDWTMDNGILAANSPAPTIVLDEDDELYLTLTNVGMAMRPDLFDAHTVHWHGFPEASAVFDGVPDASIAINMGASLTYYYQANDAGTYMYHCHVEAAEHMQMGMLGNLYVRARQNRCDAIPDDPDVPGTTCPTTEQGHFSGAQYAYNDGDGSTRFDVEKEIQMVSFDPSFHNASFTVAPLPFSGMRDRYFLLNGRGYPDTVDEAVISTVDPWGTDQPSQPVNSLVTATAGDRILLRVSNLNVTQFNTLGTNGPPMQVVARDARLLRDDDGNNMYYSTNSLTLGGGQSADVLIDTTGLAPGSVFFLYSTNLDYLANDDENFGGMMTEIHIN